LQQNRV